MNNSKNRLFNALGPGILFAGAAMGTSHLVQSTRAGAMFGLGLLLIILFANLIKYPFFRFGPLYTAVTGKSILSGYQALGRWAVYLVLVTELPVNIIIVAATALVTAGIAIFVFQLDINIALLGSILIFCSVLLIALGGYRFVDRSIKFFVATLTICTLLATILAFPSVDWRVSSFALPAIDLPTLAFLLALLGFMPSGMSLSLVHSVWSVEKAKLSKQPPSVSDVMLDLNIGYIGSTILALCFLIMGAGAFYQTDIALPQSGSMFAGKVISLYSERLGTWAAVVVGISVFTVMLSTLLAAIDGFSRMHANAIRLITKQEQADQSTSSTLLYLSIMVAIGAAAVFALFAFTSNFQGFIDFVTITAFLVGPVVAILNHMAMHGSTVPEEARPSRLMTWWSFTGIAFLICLSVVYLLS